MLSCNKSRDRWRARLRRKEKQARVCKVLSPGPEMGNLKWATFVSFLYFGAKKIMQTCKTTQHNL